MFSRFESARSRSKRLLQSENVKSSSDDDKLTPEADFSLKPRKVFGLHKESNEKNSGNSIPETQKARLLSYDPFLETFLKASKQKQSRSNLSMTDNNSSATDNLSGPISPLLLRLAIQYEPRSHNVNINITALNASTTSPTRKENMELFGINQKVQSMLMYLPFRSRILPKNDTVVDSELLYLPQFNASDSVGSSASEDSKNDVTRLFSIGLDRLLFKSSRKSASTSNGFQNSNTSLISNLDNSTLYNSHSYLNNQFDNTVNSTCNRGVDLVVGSNDLSFMSAVYISTAALLLTVLLQIFVVPHFWKKLKSVKTIHGVDSLTSCPVLPIESTVITDQDNCDNSQVNGVTNCTVVDLQTSPLRVKPSTHQSDFIEPVIVINKRERRLSSRSASKIMVDPQPQNEPVDEHPQLWTIYPQSTPEEVDTVSNPYRLSVSAIKREPVQKPRNNSHSSGGEESTVVCGYSSAGRSSEGSGDTDGLLAVYEEEDFFVEENPLETKNSHQSLPSSHSMKKILFPSFVYSNNLNNHMDCEAEMYNGTASSCDLPPFSSTAEEQKVDMPSVYEEPCYFVNDNPLSIATAEPQLMAACSPSDCGATTTATRASDTPQNTYDTSSPLKMRLKRLKSNSTAHLDVLDSPRHNTIISNLNNDHKIPAADSSDEEYGTSIHSFSFSTATFSPHPSISRSILNRTNSNVSKTKSVDRDRSRAFVTPKSAPTHDFQMMTPSNQDREATRTSSSHSSGANSFVTTHTTNNISVKRTDSFFVRPKTAASLHELTTAQIMALNKQFSLKNGVIVDNSKISTYSIDCDNNIGNSVSHRLVHKDRNINANSERKCTETNSSRNTSSASLGEFASCASDISAIDNHSVPPTTPVGAGSTSNNDTNTIQCSREMTQLSNISGLSGSSHGSSFNHSKSQAATTITTVSNNNKSTISSNDTKATQNVSFKSGSLDSSPQPRHKVNNEQVKKQSKFFRCISPCSPVNYFVRSPPPQLKSSLQLSNGTSANSAPKSYSTIHSNRIPLKSSPNTATTTINSTMSNSSLRSSSYSINNDKTVAKLGSPSKHNLLQPGSSVVRNKQQQDSAILSSLKVATTAKSSSSIVSASDVGSRTPSKNSRGIKQ